MRCFKLFQDNLESKLRALDLDDLTREEILADIVGVDGGEERQLGLVDAINVSDFEAKLSQLEERWNRLEKAGRKSLPSECVTPEFFSWFVSEKSDVVRDCMIQSVRKAAQLEGDPPEKFYTNASESTNNILKLKVDRKPQSLPAFTDHALELASSCEKNIERAFFRRGDWRFAKTFSHLEDIGETWSQKQQKSLVKRILEASCSLSSLIQEANSSGGAPSQPSSSGGGNLSQSYTVLLEGGSNIHEDTLRGIWTKARSLVSDQTLMAPVPGCKSTYHRMVASKTGDCPHMVTTPAKFTGQFKCDGKCAMYATYKVCSHTVAAAEVGGKLSEFLQWLIKQQVSPNLTTLSMVGIPKGAGQKGGVPKNTRKRKRASTAPAIQENNCGSTLC